MRDVFLQTAARRAHLDSINLLRSLTEVIARVPGGINLGQGVCDLDTPAALREGAIAAISGGSDRQTYTPYAGLPELREAIARKLRDFNGLDYDAQQVVVTAGSSAAFFAAGTTFLEPGDEVVLFEPFYSYHYSSLRMLGVEPVCVPLTGPSLAFDPDRLRAALGPRTRGIVINTPGNPSGKVFSRQELEAVGEALEGTDAIVFTDEVYEYMCFDGRPHVSPATIPSLADRTLTISSFSKTFSITGWRIGYVAGPPGVVDRIGRVFDQIDVCAARPMQRGVQRALEELPATFYADLQAGYQRRRDRFCAALTAGGWRFTPPQGAYYVMADYRDVLGDLEPHAAVLALIESRRINGVPGHVFHADPPASGSRRPAAIRSIRFHFAVDAATLDAACERLASK